MTNLHVSSYKFRNCKDRPWNFARVHVSSLKVGPCACIVPKVWPIWDDICPKRTIFAPKVCHRDDFCSFNSSGTKHANWPKFRDDFCNFLAYMHKWFSYLKDSNFRLGNFTCNSQRYKSFNFWMSFLVIRMMNAIVVVGFLCFEMRKKVRLLEEYMKSDDEIYLCSYHFVFITGITLWPYQREWHFSIENMHVNISSY